MTEKTMGHHKALLASLTAEQRSVLTERSDRKGLMALAVHFGLILVLWVLVLAKVPGWQLLILPLGVLILFLFTLLHETCHRTPFRSKRINVIVSWICGLLVLLPPNWFRYFHFEHHRYTQDPDRDPELLSPKPQTPGQYVWHTSGLPIWYSHLKTLLTNACGQSPESFIPDAARRVVRSESRIIILIYVAFISILIGTGQFHALSCWVAALLVGQPFLRLYLLAEHGGCPYVDNMFQNTRTTLTNRLVRRLAWNMPYHAEHHAYPNVPFHQLPVFHQMIRKQLAVTSDGYIEFHREVIRDIKQ